MGLRRGVGLRGCRGVIGSSAVVFVPVALRHRLDGLSRLFREEIADRPRQSVTPKPALIIAPTELVRVAGV